MADMTKDSLEGRLFFALQFLSVHCALSGQPQLNLAGLRQHRYGKLFCDIQCCEKNICPFLVS